MTKKIHKATRKIVEQKEFDNYAEAKLYGDTVETIEVQRSWMTTIYKIDVDGFAKGQMIEPRMLEVENIEQCKRIIKEFPFFFRVTSFISELDCVGVAKQLVV